MPTNLSIILFFEISGPAACLRFKYGPLHTARPLQCQGFSFYLAKDFAFNLCTQEADQSDLSKFETDLFYRVSSGLGKAT